MWSLWLDDQCFEENSPRPVPEGFIGAWSSIQAMTLVKELGPPDFIDFDYDLGGEDTAKVFLKWLWASHPNCPPSDWNVHSANPTAKAWIDSYINSWIRSLEL